LTQTAAFERKKFEKKAFLRSALAASGLGRTPQVGI
jgi:hypothetical protein